MDDYALPRISDWLGTVSGHVEPFCNRSGCRRTGLGRQRRSVPARRPSALPPNVLQNVFWIRNEEQFFATKGELGILIQRTDHSDSIIAEFPWTGGLTRSFVTQSPQQPTSSVSAVGPCPRGIPICGTRDSPDGNCARRPCGRPPAAPSRVR
jgi:hypothetical protein